MRGRTNAVLRVNIVEKKLILGAVLAFKTRINEACQKDTHCFKYLCHRQRTRKQETFVSIT